MRSLLDWWQRNTCDHWKANLVLVVSSAIGAALMMRWIVGVYAVMLPEDSWAGEMALQAAMMGTLSFGTTMAIAALGGATSLLHELRQDLAKFSLISALGHMSAAQFAGLMMFLIAVEWGVSVPWAYLLCGMAGWGGNRSLVALNDRVFVPFIERRSKP